MPCPSMHSTATAMQCTLDHCVLTLYLGNFGEIRSSLGLL